MITGELKNKIDGLWDIFAAGGLVNPPICRCIHGCSDIYKDRLWSNRSGVVL